MLKFLLKFCLRLLFLIILATGLYLLAAFTLPRLHVNTSFASKPAGIPVFVVSNGVHADLVVPATTPMKDWTADFPRDSFDANNPRYTYMAFGWGDKGFYLNTPTWNDLTFSTAFKAAFGLSSSAMHVHYLKMPAAAKKNCVQLVLDEAEYKLLAEQIEQGFAKQNDKAVKISHPGYGEYDRFYEATGTYSAFKTCNVWTNTCLKKAGVRVCLWSPFAKGLMASLKP